jgi:hypothetical protein
LASSQFLHQTLEFLVERIQARSDDAKFCDEKSDGGS